ncbi:MAG: GNAT family N-acetyltransferase [Candidatus Moraniibacteriota bacterium]
MPKQALFIIIEDGKLVPSNDPQLFNPWLQTLKTLYAAFRKEDGRDPPSKIIPFDNERVIRFIASSRKWLYDSDFTAYGMATLVLCNHGTGKRFVGHIEDVFVCQEYRYQGYAEQLILAVKNEAVKRSVIYLELTANSQRAAAHRLYEKLGFRMIAQAVPDTDNRATNLFRLPIRTM